MRTPRLPVMANAFNPDEARDVRPAERELLERRQRMLGSAYRLFYREPLHLVRGEGVWVFDSEGRRYLDAYNNVVSIGHCHPEVTAAIAQQAATLNTHTRYLHESILKYAERLLRTFPSALSHLMMTCTGSEANDLAVRISKVFTGNTGLIVTEHAYHGVTEAIAQLSPSLGPGVPRGAHVRTIPAPIGSAGTAERFAMSVREAIADLRMHGIQPAALLFDSAFTSDGVILDPIGFLGPSMDAIHAAGGLVIADEVQVGFGRTGTHMWGFARHHVVPDLVTLGKPMANGHPVAGVVGRADVIDAFGRATRYFNTFGGNPVSCAAALATLNVIERDRLLQNACSVGKELVCRLQDLAAVHSQIADIRGSGMLVGVELLHSKTRTPDATLTNGVVNGLRRRGVLISATGAQANVLKIRPPLVFTNEHVDILVSALDEALTDAVAQC